MQRLRTFACLILVISQSSFGCVCHEAASPSEWYKLHHGQPTFVGVAVSAEGVPDVVRQGGGKPLRNSSGRPISVTVRKVTFRIEESFEGIKAQTVEVFGFGTTCDYGFAVGARYLVYGWIGEDGKIRTSKCTRTAPVVDAKDDLKFLRSLKNNNALQ